MEAAQMYKAQLMAQSAAHTAELGELYAREEAIKRRLAQFETADDVLDESLEKMPCRAQEKPPRGWWLDETPHIDDLAFELEEEDDPLLFELLSRQRGKSSFGEQ